MEKLELTVRPDQAGRTLESLMRRELAMTPGMVSAVKFRPDGITVNGVRARVTETVRPGDTLAVRIGDTGTNDAAPLDRPLSILWEDDALAVLDKPAGVGVYGEGTPNIAGILAYMWGKDIEYHPVNRLDVGTSGIMVAAKDGYTHERLRRLLHTEDFRREYLAVAQGVPSRKRGTVPLPIAREPAEGAKRYIDPAGLPARTDYEVLEVRDGLSLLRLRLHTGRTHQIRVHMAALGCPLVGDALYGVPDPRIARPALHSHHLLLRHPITGERLDLTAPLPEDMAALLALLDL